LNDEIILSIFRLLLAKIYALLVAGMAELAHDKINYFETMIAFKKENDFPYCNFFYKII